MDYLNGTQIEELSALLALAKEGSFEKAGRALLRHPTIISRRLASLEERLGVRLVERTTRRVRLTEAGERLAKQVRQAQDEIQAAEDAASSDAAQLRGKIAIALPAAMGRKWIAPMLPEFMRLYPKIEMLAHFSEDFADLVQGGFDVAVRIGKLSDSGLIAKKLADHERILCASPAYLAERGAPGTPAMLAEHDCLQFNGFATFPEWHLSDGRKKETVLPSGMLIANDSPSLVEAAKAGCGILGVGEWLVTDEIEQGTLVRVLPNWAFDLDGGIFLLRPSKRHTPAHVAAFCDWMAARFQGGAPWRQGARQQVRV